MIVPMTKINFLGATVDKDRFIKRLQEVGLTHLILPKEGSEPTELIKELQRVAEVRKFLARLLKSNQEQIEPDPPASDCAELCRRRDELNQREQKLNSEVSLLKKERVMVEPWGDFRFEDVDLLRRKGLRVQFFRLQRRQLEETDLSGVFYQLTSETPTSATLVTISTEPVDLGCPEERLPEKSLTRIDQEIKARETELAEVQQEYTQLARHFKTLTLAEAELTDDVSYQRARLNANAELDGRIFFLQAWSPVPEEELIRRIGPGFALYHWSEPPNEDDKIPVLLSNKSAFNSGEDLVEIYSHPNYKDFDPSGLVLYIFAIFYGMIIGDAGYGFFFLGLTVLLHWKVKSQAPLWIRFRRLSYLLAFSVIFFGLITASYYGIHLKPENALNRLQLMDLGTVEGQNQVMLISIIMGMAHLSMALAIKFYRQHYLPALGWIIVIWSGFKVIYTNMTTGQDSPVALWIMIGGLALVVLFTSQARNLLIRFLEGLNGAMGIVQLFADVLSYMRLFALGLATMYMCQTFNMLGEMVYQALPYYLGVVPAVLVLVFGHGINVLLGIMGGVVHGLRLNFLEWYRWCFEGDGLQYKPFKATAKELSV